MPNSGVSGVDLFRFDVVTGEYRFVGVTTVFPTVVNTAVTIVLASGLPPVLSDYIAYLPLRNTLNEGYIGELYKGRGGEQRGSLLRLR